MFKVAVDRAPWWTDARNGGNGVMARRASGTDGITSIGAGYGVLWATPGGYGYGYGDMAFGRPSKRDDVANAIAGTIVTAAQQPSG